MSTGGTPIQGSAGLGEALLVRARKLRQAIERKIPARFRTVISADDVLQQVWINALAYHRSPNFAVPKSLDAWLQSIAEHALIDFIKSATRVKRGGQEAARPLNDFNARSFITLAELAVARNRTPSRDAASVEAVTAVRLALASMPESNRRALCLHYVEGHTRQEIAQLMGRTPCAVNNLLFRGLQNLRDRLGDAQRFFSDARSCDRERRASCASV